MRECHVLSFFLISWYFVAQSVALIMHVFYTLASADFYTLKRADSGVLFPYVDKVIGIFIMCLA